MSVVELKDLVKAYGHVFAVRGIDLVIPDESLVVLVGPSGCGKSTTLRMVAGLETISYGELLIDGVNVNTLPSRDRGVAMVFQSYALYPHMTVRQNLEYSLKLEKLPKAEIEDRVRSAAEVLEIGAYMDRKPANLSGGQRQRVAMGRAIVRKPKVFLFDEPLSNLDAKLRNQMRVEIKRLQKQLKVTTIYVTHDQIEAMTMADIIVVMRDGNIEQSGTPMEVFGSPANQFVAGFIGSPQMNFFSGEIAEIEGALHLVNDHLTVPIPSGKFDENIVVGQKITAGFRPEDIIPVGHGMEPEQYVEVEAKVTFVEMLGNETLLYLGLGNEEFVSRMQQPKSVNLDDVINFQFNVGKIHLFDADSGNSLRNADQ